MTLSASNQPVTALLEWQPVLFFGSFSLIMYKTDIPNVRLLAFVPRTQRRISLRAQHTTCVT